MKNTISMTVIYGATALIAFLLVIGYWKILKKKEKWLSFLYIAVLTVNIGYFVLSMSRTLQEALWANRLVYLASVFLPLAMFMIIKDVCQLVYKRKYVIFHIVGSIIVFCVAASGGYAKWYYKAVTISFINGAAVLIKEYGPMHSLYGVYLLLYFTAMIGIILYAMKKRKNIPYKIAGFLLAIVLGNMVVWFIEQLFHTEFEFLAVSYIFTAGLLLGLYMILEEYSLEERKNHEKPICDEVELVFFQSDVVQLSDNSMEYESGWKENKTSDEKKKQELTNCVLQKITRGALDGLENLSVREIEVLLLILDNKKRKSIAEEMEITENTVKKHTTHIFSKLGVASRKELFEKCDNNTSEQ